MMVTWRLVSILSLVRYTHSECSSISYYRECWIRRFPGLQVDVEESQRRGAQLLRIYRGDSGQNCSRTCCLTTNFSCNVAVFHYNTTQDRFNCFHLQCPTLQSCILQQRAHVIVYNVTKGMDPDLLIFGKPFPFNAQVLSHLASLNISDPSGTDKRQFNRPHVEPSSSPNPTISSTATKHTTGTPTSTFFIPTLSSFSDSSTQHNQDKRAGLEIQQSTTPNRPSQLISTHNVGNPSTYPTIISTTKTFPASRNSIKASLGFTNKQTSSMPQPTHTFGTTITTPNLSSQFTSSFTSSSLVRPLGTTTAFTISPTALPDFKTLTYLYRGTTLGSGQTTTSMLVPFSDTLQSGTGETATISNLLPKTPESSKRESTIIPFTTKTTPQNSVAVTTTLTVPVLNTLQSSSGKISASFFSFSTATQSITRETTTMPVSHSNIIQSTTRNTPSLTVHLSSTLQSNTENTTTKTIPLSSTLQRNTEKTTTRTVPVLSIPQTTNGKTTTHTRFAVAQQSFASASLTLVSTFTPVRMTGEYETTTTAPQPMTNSFTTTSQSYNQPINTQSSASPPMEKTITPSLPTDRDLQEYTNLANPVVSVTTTSPTTLGTFQLPVATSETNSGLHTSPTTPSILEDSQPYPNDTKGYISRNVTTDNNPQPVSDGGLTQVWHLAANTVLIALATCAALVCGCCCSVLMAASWRGRKRRKGRYQTMLKGKKGSMRLIKYVFVRESS
ncbi:MANSC domain-containing protein 4 [Bagarius yarrelli]|uniref:MANSC domain-containing protein 4 n=1 Tax=Bagarius yarrelli TaxID=175774 RepID=A0A556THV8_BAGYA|nr:MANSC domain-containing protein 4 [Bagarius yarrelli]